MYRWARALSHMNDLGLLAELEQSDQLQHATGRRREDICVVHVTLVPAVRGAFLFRVSRRGLRSARRVIAGLEQVLAGCCGG